MRDTDTTHDASTSGLTTDDLAHPKTDTSREDTTAQDTTLDAARDEPPPAYPGEAAPVPGTTEEAPAEPPEEPASAEEPATAAAPEQGPPLIPPGEAESYRDRWQEIQGTFVDDPRDSVRAADALVADVIQSLAANFADHKKDLESQWSRGEEIETEGLRVALQRYRTFFNRLLHA
ncbi:hypothetical protein [Streptomyces sp. NPDC002133]|uniref:hypothetical protein n=1 Tax=Streptomyces sp. NPDC002133 TaxID=3154409 RepID=UPI0033241714